jgi:hypothetical protein
MDLPESHYVEQYCKGQIEHVLPDRTRIDCLTDTHAIEFDFCHKWAESIGQALYYANSTGRSPKIVLICRPDEQRFYYRVRVAAPDITVEVIDR